MKRKQPVLIRKASEHDSVDPSPRHPCANNSAMLIEFLATCTNAFKQICGELGCLPDTVKKNNCAKLFRIFPMFHASSVQFSRLNRKKSMADTFLKKQITNQSRGKNCFGPTWVNNERGKHGIVGDIANLHLDGNVFTSTKP